MMTLKKRRIRKLTVEEYMTDWLTTVKQPVLKPASYDRVEQSLRYQVFPTIGNMKLRSLSADDIQFMVNNAVSNSSYSTAKKAYNNINSCLNLAVEKGLIDKNPASAVVLPRKRENKDISSYTEEQIKLIVNEAASIYKNGKFRYRYGYAIILMLNTGMRLGEALYLKWKDVNLDKRYIYIHGNVSNVKTHDENSSTYHLIEQDTPKTNKSTRYITLNDNAVQALEKLKGNIGNSGRVIATKSGTIVSPHKIYDTMKRILEQCDIYGTTDILHALRHTFATMLIRNGVDVKVVSELLGHSDVSTTIRIYYHIIEEQKHSAVQKLDNFY